MSFDSRSIVAFVPLDLLEDECFAINDVNANPVILIVEVARIGGLSRSFQLFWIEDAALQIFTKLQIIRQTL